MCDNRRHSCFPHHNNDRSTRLQFNLLATTPQTLIVHTQFSLHSKSLRKLLSMSSSRRCEDQGSEGRWENQDSVEGSLVHESMLLAIEPHTSVPLGVAQLLKLVWWTDCGRLWKVSRHWKILMCNDQKGIGKQTHNEARVILAAPTHLATLVLNTHVHFLPCVSSQHATLVDAPQVWTIVCNELYWLYCTCKGFCSYRSIVV